MPPAQSEAQVAEEVARMKEAARSNENVEVVQILLLGHRPHDPLLQRLRDLGHRISPAKAGGVQRTVFAHSERASICI